MSHIYFVWKQPNQPDRVLVWDTNTISIGRSPENDIALEDDEVSRRHAVFARGKGGHQVMDFRTSNGTTVNGERVKQERMIQPGDTIKIGSHEFALKTGEKHPASLGLKVQYASQLKSVGALPKNMDAGATMLGLANTQPHEGEQMVVEPERGAGGQAFVVGAQEQDAYQMREIGDGLDSMELDLDGDGLGGDFGGELDQGFDLAGAEEKPEPAPVAAPARAAAPRAAPPPAQAPRAAAAPKAAAPAAAGEDATARLRKLKTLHEEGLITDEEFQTKRAQILSEM
jgi:predicted component of type VI protein secretion system